MDQPLYTVEPWCVRETELHLDRLGETEAVFTLANGHIGLRGNLDEGEPHGIPGTYLNSVYELRPLPYGEAGYGYPESGESIINVTNGKVVRLLVDDEPFDVRYGRVLHHERALDLRAGTLRRDVTWESPAGRCVERLQPSSGVAHPTVGGGHLLRGGAGRDGPSRRRSSPNWCRTRRCPTSARIRASPLPSSRRSRSRPTSPSNLAP